MTALVSFDRVFEVLDLPPMIDEKPDAVAIPRGPALHRVRPRRLRLPERRGGVAGLAGVGGRPRAHRVPAGALRRVVPGRARTARGAGGPVGCGQDDHQPSRAAALRRAGRRGAHQRRSTSATPRWSRSGRSWAWSPRTPTSSTRPSGPTCATPSPTPPTTSSIEALRAAHILPLVESLPDGLDTLVGDRGYRLSGGEKQRIAIARLLLKAPDIVVLDEATAHLDSESEVAVQQALKTGAGRPHLARHRPPALDGARGGHDPRHRGGTDRRAGPPRRAARRGRPVLPSSTPRSSSTRPTASAPRATGRCSDRAGARVRGDAGQGPGTGTGGGGPV